MVSTVVWVVIAILIVFWLMGNILGIAGDLIHLILLACGVLFVIDYFKGKNNNQL